MCDRDEFESAVKGLCLNNPLGWSEGEYESNSTQALWDIWQAARAQVGEAVEFGQGSWTVEVGEYGKQPAVFVAPADPPGVPGELSEPTTGADKRRLVPGECVMTFPTEGQAFEVAGALTGRRIKRLDGDRPDDSHPSASRPNLSTIAQKKLDQMGATIHGVLVKNEAGAWAAVSDAGRVMWLDGFEGQANSPTTEGAE